MNRLYPAEPAKSRAEFGSLVKAARWAAAEEAVRSSESPREPEAAPSPAPASEAQPELLVGNFLPGTRYRLLRTLGEGAMGVVYEAEHVDLLRRVALKVMSIEQASSRVAA